MLASLRALHAHQLVDNPAPGFGGLDRLSIGDDMDVEVMAAQGGFQRVQVQWCDNIIADDQGFTQSKVVLPN